MTLLEINSFSKEIRHALEAGCTIHCIDNFCELDWWYDKDGYWEWSWAGGAVFIPQKVGKTVDEIVEQSLSHSFLVEVL